MSNINDAPCHKCDYKGCGSRHSSCDKYLDWKRGVDETNRKAKLHEERPWKSGVKHLPKGGVQICKNYIAE